MGAASVNLGGGTRCSNRSLWCARVGECDCYRERLAGEKGCLGWSDNNPDGLVDGLG